MARTRTRRSAPSETTAVARRSSNPPAPRTARRGRSVASAVKETERKLRAGFRKTRERLQRKGAARTAMCTAVTQVSSFGAGMARGWLGPARFRLFGFDPRFALGMVGTGLGLYGAFTDAKGHDLLLSAGSGVLASFSSDAGARAGAALATNQPVPNLLSPPPGAVQVRGWGDLLDEPQPRYAAYGAYETDDVEYVDDDVGDFDDFDEDDALVEAEVLD